MRPKSLAEVSKLALQGHSFDLGLKEFLDEFYSHPSSESLAEEPARLAEKLPENGLLLDAYLAAVAEHLAFLRNVQAPGWAFAADRKMSEPWFPMNTKYEPLRTLLLQESPPAFRSRNLFVSENALSRA